MTNGEDLVAVVYMKPISTLARGLDSVDLETGESARAAYERSDVTAVPACGVIAEAMLAFVLADALLELTGGAWTCGWLATHRKRVERTRVTSPTVAYARTVCGLRPHRRPRGRSVANRERRRTPLSGAPRTSHDRRPRHCASPGLWHMA